MAHPEYEVLSTISYKMCIYKKSPPVSAHPKYGQLVNPVTFGWDIRFEQTFFCWKAIVTWEPFDKKPQ